MKDYYGMASDCNCKLGNSLNCLSDAINDINSVSSNIQGLNCTLISFEKEQIPKDLVLVNNLQTEIDIIMQSIKNQASTLHNRERSSLMEEQGMVG